MSYTVGEMSKILGVPASTLRYYDKQGLLPFVERSKGGIRLFQDVDLEWLRIIECLKKSGMSLSEIKRFILLSMDGDDSIDERLVLMQKQYEVVHQQMLELQETLNTVEYKCWYYQTAKERGTLEGMNEVEVPKRFKNVVSRLKNKEE